LPRSIELPGLTEEEVSGILPPKTLLLGYMGSHSHGTYIPKENPDSIDDIDIMGVAVADEKVYMGLQSFEQKEAKYREWDSVVYEIRKYFRLLLQQNPNVLGLLWLREQEYVHISGPGRLIIENRRLFVSKEAYHSFAGYAQGQLKRMTHFEFRGFMGKKRKELVERYGYDCKNAAHLIRLLRMGIEFLADGELKVYRHDAEELKAIKSGQWTLEEVKKEADSLFEEARRAYESSPLPAAPDREKAERLLLEIIRSELELS
jgi:uncharacterized protein